MSYYPVNNSYYSGLYGSGGSDGDNTYGTKLHVYERHGAPDYSDHSQISSGYVKPPSDENLLIAIGFVVLFIVLFAFILAFTGYTKL